MSLVDLAATETKDRLDDYIEAHIHGPLRFATDVEATPAILEAAVRTERHHPQDLKKVWHYLARFGDCSSC
jgi:hypothetical protein